MNATKMMKSVIAAALLAAGSAYAAPVVELIHNGGFEIDPQGYNSWDIYRDLTGWTGGVAGIELRNSVEGVAAGGHNFVELDTSSNSSMTQLIQTVANRTYTLTFQFQDRVNVASASQGLSISWGNSVVTPLVNNSYLGGWETRSFTLIGDGTEKALTFSAAGYSDGLGTSLDNVSLTTAVPEPETYGMMLVGLAAIGLVARRRKA